MTIAGGDPVEQVGVDPYPAVGGPVAAGHRQVAVIDRDEPAVSPARQVQVEPDRPGGATQQGFVPTLRQIRFVA